mmetsp:Transcript_51153/g.163761  ORF Transcript_51153/g.163761 Transcript_51153/m.163761 type:complete len:200 (+) Transcript_51153:215-814(+)
MPVRRQRGLRAALQGGAPGGGGALGVGAGAAGQGGHLHRRAAGGPVLQVQREHGPALAADPGGRHRRGAREENQLRAHLSLRERGGLRAQGHRAKGRQGRLGRAEEATCFRNPVPHQARRRQGEEHAAKAARQEAVPDHGGEATGVGGPLAQSGCDGRRKQRQQEGLASGGELHRQHEEHQYREGHQCGQRGPGAHQGP